MARLQDAKCSFDVIRWTNDEKRRQKLLDNMRQYPEKPINEVHKRPPLKKSYRQKNSAGGNVYNSVIGTPMKSDIKNRLP